MSLHSKHLPLLLALLAAVATVGASKHAASIASMSIADIDSGVQVSCHPNYMGYPLLISAQQCALVQDLNAYKSATSPPTSSFSSAVFSYLFPSANPAVNSLLATLYISGPPNFLLALCPPNIDPASLSIMVAFAVGGLLGDTLFHLLPEIFLGEEGEKVRFVLVEGNRNLLLGLAIMAGFLTFVAMDKGLRIATGGAGHEHGHSEGAVEEHSAVSTAVEHTPSDGMRSRKENGNGHAKTIAEVPKEKEINASVKLAGYLNLM